MKKVLVFLCICMQLVPLWGQAVLRTSLHLFCISEYNFQWRKPDACFIL